MLAKDYNDTKSHYLNMKDNCILEVNINNELTRIKEFFVTLKQVYSTLQTQSNILDTITNIKELESPNQEYLQNLEMQSNEFRSSFKSSKETVKSLKSELSEIIQLLSESWKEYQKLNIDSINKEANEPTTTINSDSIIALNHEVNSIQARISEAESEVIKLQKQYNDRVIVAQPSNGELNTLLKNKELLETLTGVKVQLFPTSMNLQIEMGENKTATECEILFAEDLSAFVKIILKHGEKDDFLEQLIDETIKTQRLAFFIREYRALFSY